MSKFYVNNKGKGTKKDFCIKVNGCENDPLSRLINTNTNLIRIGKIHIDLMDYMGMINHQVSFKLTN